MFRTFKTRNSKLLAAAGRDVLMTRTSICAQSHSKWKCLWQQSLILDQIDTVLTYFYFGVWTLTRS